MKEFKYLRVSLTKEGTLAPERIPSKVFPPGEDPGHTEETMTWKRRGYRQTSLRRRVQQMKSERLSCHPHHRLDSGKASEEEDEELPLATGEGATGSSASNCHFHLSWADSLLTSSRKLAFDH